jgi:hypothetical protein
MMLSASFICISTTHQPKHCPRTQRIASNRRWIAHASERQCFCLLPGAGHGVTQSSTVVYNSKTTQNIPSAPASGGAFDGTYLSSKAGSHLVDPRQEEVATRSAVNGSSVAINTTYDTKTMRPVAFAPSFETSHPNSSTIVSTNKNNVQSGSDVAMK